MEIFVLLYENEVFFIDNIMDMEQVYNQIISGNIDIVNDLSIDDVKIIIKTLVQSLEKERKLNGCVAAIHMTLLNRIHEVNEKIMKEQKEEEKIKRRQSEMTFLY